MTFEELLNSVLNLFEGGYAFNVLDPGQETYRGIARAIWPKFNGWELVDQIKRRYPDARDDWDGYMRASEPLQDRVISFYRFDFWDNWRGDEVLEISPAIAFEVLEGAINQGLERTAIFLQTALNTLDRGKAEDLVLDGVVGPKTILRLERSGDPLVVVKMLECQQGMRYMEIMHRNPRMEIFARSWFRRVRLG